MNHRQTKRNKAGHADDWLMTYADMITLLSCLFVLLAAASITHKLNELKTQAVQKEITQKPTPPEPMVEKTPDSQFEQALLSNLSQEIVDNLKSESAANTEQGGDRISSIEMSSATFFDSGSALLSPAGKEILRGLAENLKAEKFQDYKITVEGHTDDAPITTSLFPSNWELSTARAAAVVRFFLNEGVPAHRLRAAGYADTFPKAPNRDSNGISIPENQAQNRRVVIKLDKIEKKER